MDANSKQEKRRDGVLSSLNAAIEVMNLAKDISKHPQPRVAFAECFRCEVPPDPLSIFKRSNLATCVDMCRGYLRSKVKNA